jgi:hypothetical protein
VKYSVLVEYSHVLFYLYGEGKLLKNGIDRAYTMYGRKEERIHSFGWKSTKKETTEKT